MSAPAVRCPSGCGSREFSAVRRGVVVQDFTVDAETGDLVPGDSNAEAGGRLTLRCSDCGRTWASRGQAAAGLALYVDGTAR